MADRTYFQLTVHHCPEDQVGAVLDIIAEHGLHPEYEDGGPREDQLALGLTYMDDETRCGSADTIAHQLVEQAPQASFELWEDPKYEWLGDLRRYTPQLGVFAADCDSEGNAVFTVEKVKNLAALPDTVNAATGDSPRARALGETHAAALRALAEKNAGVVMDRPSDD